MNICTLPYKSSKMNLSSFLEEMGAVYGNQILDLDLFREVNKQIENDLNNSYGIQASPFIEDDLTGSKTFYTNDKVFERIDEVRKELGLYEDRIAGSYSREIEEQPVEQDNVLFFQQKFYNFESELEKYLIDNKIIEKIC